MVTALLILGGTYKSQTKITGGDLSKKFNLGGGAKFKGASKILGGPMNIVSKGGHTPPPIF